MTNVCLVISHLLRKGLAFLLLMLLNWSIALLFIVLCPFQLTCDFVGKLADLLFETASGLLLGSLDLQSVVLSNFTQCYHLSLSAFILGLQQPTVYLLHPALHLFLVLDLRRGTTLSLQCRSITFIREARCSPWSLFSIGLPGVKVAL